MIDDYLNSRIAEVNKNLKNYMNLLPHHIPGELKEAMEYSLFAGGKRLRPIFLLEFAKAFGENVENCIPLSCAIEMIHTYSLVHDDLPAMDNDDYRRGKLTNHKVYGEDMAILAGDALLNYAFEIMINASLNVSGQEQMQYLKAVKEITSAAGPSGMIAGQVADIANCNEGGKRETLDFINTYKTGALLKASILAGPIAQGTSQDIIEELSMYSEKIGEAFQIVDDILDVIGDQQKIGKQIHSDEKNNKKTYVGIYGIEKSKKIVDTLIQAAFGHLKNCHVDNQNIVELTNFVCKREY